MKPAELIAIARISRPDAQPGRYRFTAGEPTMVELSPPREIWLYRSLQQESKLVPVAEGLHDSCELFQAVLMRVGGNLRSGWAEFSGVPDTLEGWWVCIPRVELLADDSFYSFQLVGCRVVRHKDGEVLAQVVRYYETGAHGVLVTKLPDGEEVLLPLVPQHVELCLEDGLVLVPHFEDFCI